MNLRILPLLLILLTTCKQQPSEKKQGLHDNIPKHGYTENAVKITAANIEAYSKNQEDPITSATSLFKTEANKDRGIAYEIILFKTADLKEYVQLVIWENKLLAFEYTVVNTVDAIKVDTSQIAKNRNLWIQLCNAHNAENLVTQLYTSDALYFNHKPLIKGTADLIKEYGYMNDPNYTLTLKPAIVKAVNPTTVFEIGQCEGTYNGKYVLVWKKQPNGEWKIFIDSNV